MEFPRDTLKIRSINEEKQTAVVTFANTTQIKKMKIIAKDEHDLTLRHVYSVYKGTFLINNFELNKWVTYKLIGE